MKILQIISHLLNYPTAQLQDCYEEIKTIILTTTQISPKMRQHLLALVDDIYQQDLLDAQETYTGLFDRGRALSLLLFEHVHGESRDRGQAMVDLMALYQNHGFHINVRELPDYIPLYLEYLAQCPPLQAREGLADVAHILALLSARLQERNSCYSILFDALLMISGTTVDSTTLRQQASQEIRDDTPEALDQAWEEQAITFGAGDAHSNACSTLTPNTPQNHSASEQRTPLHWVDTASATQ